MGFSRAPAWRCFPPTDPPSPPLMDVVSGMTALSSWFESTFWPDAEETKMNTLLITKQLENHLLPADPVVMVDAKHHLGWNVETRDVPVRIPLLYGENGKELYGVQPDAVWIDVNGDRALFEIEGGGAVTNNRLMKDVIESLLIHDVRYLALALPHSVHHTSPYDFAVNLVSALYARQVPQAHIDGVVIIGY